jgi:hypothetical protein
MQFTKVRMDRDQVAYVAECVLTGALNMVDGGLPTGISWDQRVVRVGLNAGRLSWYELGCLDTAGMGLSILFAQLCDDGMGAGDALMVAGDFQKAVEELFLVAWADMGVGVLDRVRERKGSSYSFGEVFLNYPDVHEHAAKFADFVCSVMNLPKD